MNSETNGQVNGQVSGHVEWYKKYRPSTLKGIIGQEEEVKSLKDMVLTNRIPHSIMITGPSGVGKTTIARILAKKLKCTGMDFDTIACANVQKPIETIRDIRLKMNSQPMESPCRVFLLDEIQSMVRSRPAQQALLEMLEDTPPHVYFILATTNPEKLIVAIRTRCITISLKPLSENYLMEILKRVAIKEKVTASEEELSKIAYSAFGSARWAINEFQRIAPLAPGEERLKAIRTLTEENTGGKLCNALLNNRTKWAEIASILKEATESAEELRRGVLDYAGKILLTSKEKTKRDWAATIITRFECNFNDGDKPQLYNACYDMLGRIGK